MLEECFCMFHNGSHPGFYRIAMLGPERLVNHGLNCHPKPRTWHSHLSFLGDGSLRPITWWSYRMIQLNILGQNPKLRIPSFQINFQFVELLIRRVMDCNKEVCFTLEGCRDTTVFIFCSI